MKRGSSKDDGSVATWIGWGTALTITLAIAALASSTPLLPPGLRQIVMSMFSGVCHQLPTRSPHVGGVQLAVCHRCLGIYWALPAAAIVYRLVRGAWPFHGRSALFLLLASVLPAGVDWLGDVLGLWTNTPASRMITGALFGLVAGYYLARAVGEIIRQRAMSRLEVSAKME